MPKTPNYCVNFGHLKDTTNNSPPASIVYRLLFTVSLLLALALRLSNPAWDQGIAAHPDERFLLAVAQQTPLWGDPCVTAPNFPYGHLPVYAARLLIPPGSDADPLYAARLLSGIVGVAMVALAGGVGRLLGNRSTGLLAMVLLAFAPHAIQQAHFYTVDPWATVFATAALLVALREGVRNTLRFALAGALAGLAVASKLSLAAVFFPLLLLAFRLHFQRRGAEKQRCRETEPPSDPNIQQPISNSQSYLNLLGSLAAGALLALVLAAPWSLLRPVACWRGPLTQAGMAAGRYDFPFTRQYTGTWPYIYPLAQMALWGLGPLATAAGLLALSFHSLWRIPYYVSRLTPHVLRNTQYEIRNILPPTSLSISLLWPLLYFLLTAALPVKFPRYMLPLYPWWVAWAAHWLWPGRRHSYSCRVWCSPPRPFRSKPHLGARETLPPPWRILVVVLTLLTTLVPGLAQVSVYRGPHPWVAASRWLAEHLPPGSVIAIEDWDHPLPVPVAGVDPAQYTQLTLPIWEPESLEKQAALRRIVAQADVVVLASRRGYAALARQPEAAPTMAWYTDLLRTRQAVVFGRCPRLGPLAFSDDAFAAAGLPLSTPLSARCQAPYVLRLPSLDESFRVYDAPTVVLLATSPIHARISQLE